MFLKVAVIPNKSKDSDLIVSRNVSDILSQNGCTVFSTEEMTPFSSAVFSAEEAIQRSDIAVTVGGDGTILHVARIASVYETPILGINLGRVGFMAEIESSELSKLKSLTDKSYSVEKRMMVSCEVFRKGTSVFSTFALNDAVISKGALSRMIEFDVYSGEESVHAYRADGIVFSSPTGSTAYSLSAGGPIVDPAINCIILTPVCVHSLFAARSVIFRENTLLQIKMKTSDDTPAFLTADGIDNFPLEKDDIVEISRSAHCLDLIRLKNDSFYSVLAKKIK